MTSKQQQHITSGEWTAFRRRALPNDQLQRVSQHVRDCDSCRRTVDTHALTLPEVAPERPFHLTYEQLTGYLNARRPQELAQWTAVEQHLSFCGSCTRELNDLREFDAKSAPLPQAAVAAKPGLLASIRNFFTMPQTPAFTGAASALAMAGIFLIFNGASAGLDPVSPSTAVGAVTSDSYFVRNAFSMQNLAGALLAVTGVAALVYRFTAKK
jgi:hypothetical protein